jgi:hypothetical protein
MKFALIELKMTLVKLLLNYEVRSTEKTPEVLTFREGLVRTPKDGLNVVFKKRNSTKVSAQNS